MNQATSSSLTDLQQSLESIKSLRYSIATSTILMLVGVAVIGASFVYSITRLRPLEDQVAQKQGELDQLNLKIVQAQNEIKNLQDTHTVLLQQNQDLIAKNEIAQQQLKSAGEVASNESNPQVMRQRILQIVTDATKVLNTPKPAPLPPSDSGTLQGTTWDYNAGTTHYLIRFSSNNKYQYQNDRGQWFDGVWTQSGNKVSILTSNAREREIGVINGNKISGQGWSEGSPEYSWTATKRP